MAWATHLVPALGLATAWAQSWAMTWAAAWALDYLWLHRLLKLTSLA